MLVGEISGNREVGSMLRDTRKSENGADSLVQSVPEIDGSVAGTASQCPWHGFTKSNLEHLVSAVRVWLSDNAACVVVATLVG